MINDEESIRQVADLACKAGSRLLAKKLGDFVCTTAFDVCESPIEQLMLLTFSACASWQGTFSVERHATFDGLAFAAKEDNDAMRVIVSPQVAIGDYRIDICLAATRADMPPVFIAIECDGHDFHEKTKKQAARDKARDRYLVSRNLIVMRFAGSEIWADAAKCVLQVMDLVDAKQTESLLRKSDRIRETYRQSLANKGLSHDPR